MHTDNRSVSQLVVDALSELSKLFRNELDLARAELLQKLGIVGGAAKAIAAGALLIIPALVLVLLGVAAELIQLGMAAPLSYAATGVAAGIVGAGLVWSGLSKLSGSALRPAVTLDEINRDRAVAKELTR